MTIQKKTFIFALLVTFGLGILMAVLTTSPKIVEKTVEVVKEVKVVEYVERNTSDRSATTTTTVKPDGTKIVVEKKNDVIVNEVKDVVKEVKKSETSREVTSPSSNYNLSILYSQHYRDSYVFDERKVGVLASRRIIGPISAGIYVAPFKGDVGVSLGVTW